MPGSARVIEAGPDDVVVIRHFGVAEGAER